MEKRRVHSLALAGTMGLGIGYSAWKPVIEFLVGSDPKLTTRHRSDEPPHDSCV